MGRRSILLLLLLLPATVSGQNPIGPRVDIVPSGTGTGQTGQLRFYELLANGTNYVGFQASDSLAGNVIWKLPSVDGTSGQALITDGAGTLSWGAGGGGGGGCNPTGGAGEVLFSDGAGACSDVTDFFWDDGNKRLRIGAVVTPLAATQLLVAASAATTQATLYGDAANNQVLRFEKADSTAWSLYRPASSSEFRFFYSALGDVAAIESDGDFRLTRNDVGFWVNDSVSTARRLVWYDGANTSYFGTSEVTSPAGNAVFQAGDIGVSLVRAATNTGTFGSRDTSDTLALGDATHPFTSGRVLGGFTLGVTPTLVPGTLVLTSVSGNTINIDRTTGGSNYSIHMPNANAAGALTNDGSGNLLWTTGGGSFTCNTAGNCFNLTDTQTANGAKTFGSEAVFNIGIVPDVDGGAYVGTVLKRFNNGYFQTINISGSSTLTGSVSAGAITTVGINVVAGTVAIGGTSVISSTRQFTNVNGISTDSSSNSTFYVGASGNFYNRVLGGASTAVSCAGVANGWTAIATDNYIVACRSGTRYRAQLVAF